MKNKKNISIYCLLKILPRVLSVKRPYSDPLIFFLSLKCSLNHWKKPHSKYIYFYLYYYIFFSFSFSFAAASSLAFALRSDRLLRSLRNDSLSDFFSDFLLDIGVSEVPVKSAMYMFTYLSRSSVKYFYSLKWIGYTVIAPDIKSTSSIKNCWHFSYFSTKIYVVDTH